jgi:hypothetical protein
MRVFKNFYFGSAKTFPKSAYSERGNCTYKSDIEMATLWTLSMIALAITVMTMKLTVKGMQQEGESCSREEELGEPGFREEEAGRK